MNFKTKQTLAVIFSIGGAVGTLATTLLTRKASLKEAEILASGVDIYKKPLKEQIKILTSIYGPTAAVGLLTIGSIIGSTVMSHKAQASLMSMAVLADRGWKKYKHQVKSTLGIDSHNDILKSLAKNDIKNNLVSFDKSDDGKELYYDEIAGYFKAKPEDIAYAYAEINEILNTDYKNQKSEVFDFVTIGSFLRLANAELIDQTFNMNVLDSWGWTMDYLSDLKHWLWIKMQILDEKTDDGEMSFKVISWDVEPIFLEGTEYYLSMNDLDVEKIDGVLADKYRNMENLTEKKKSRRLDILEDL